MKENKNHIENIPEALGVVKTEIKGKANRAYQTEKAYVKQYFRKRKSKNS